MREWIKTIAYRAPVIGRAFAPRYPYMLDPAQLSFLCDGITQTADIGGAVLEIGVARGMTSTFLLEHLRTTRDARSLTCIDTFAGFTPESVNFETARRGKSKEEMSGFQYGDEAVFTRNLIRSGYTNFQTVRGDASTLDYSKIGPISVVLVDIDLYQPTIKVLEAIWPYLTKPAFICVDDCLADSRWDGSLQAYQEFCASKHLPERYVGRKGGVIAAP